MAEENGKRNSGFEEPIQNGTESGQSSDTGTKSTGKGRKRKTAGIETAGTETAGRTEEKEQFSELASVNDSVVPEPEKTVKKAKRKRTKTTSKNNPSFNAEQITNLLMTASSILGASEGGRYFCITKEEAEQIAIPLANIIAKNDAFNGIGEHSDSIALVTACFMIFVPRVIGWLTYKKHQKTMKDKNVKILKGVEPNGKKAEDSGSNRGVNESSSVSPESNGSGILSGLPSLA